MLSKESPQGSDISIVNVNMDSGNIERLPLRMLISDDDAGGDSSDENHEDVEGEDDWWFIDFFHLAI